MGQMLTLHARDSLRVVETVFFAQPNTPVLLRAARMETGGPCTCSREGKAYLHIVAVDTPTRWMALSQVLIPGLRDKISGPVDTSPYMGHII